MATTKRKTIGSALKYPTGRVDRNGMDYVVFERFEWTPNFVPGNRQAMRSTLAKQPPANGHIMLYMPNTTPDVTNKNNWNGKGGIMGGGAIGRAAMAAAGAAGATAAGDFGNATTHVGKGVVDALTNAPQIAAQGILAGTANKLGMNANQAMQLGTGKILNPNVELFYEGPALRGFAMQFDFVPRNKQDQQAMQDIIYEFKYWSSPEPMNNLYKIPQIWQVTYVSGGKVDVMNRFKRAALTDIQVQANPDLNMHATYDDGTPIATSMALTFMETDVITREDHAYVGGQGF